MSTGVLPVEGVICKWDNDQHLLDILIGMSGTTIKLFPCCVFVLQMTCRHITSEFVGLFVWKPRGRHLIFLLVRCSFSCRSGGLVHVFVTDCNKFPIISAALTLSDLNTFPENKNDFGGVNTDLKFFSSLFLDVKIILAFFEMVSQCFIKLPVTFCPVSYF